MGATSASAKAKDENLVVEKKSNSGAAKGKKVTEPSFNMDELRELAELVNESGFTDFEFENENIRVRLSKMSSVPVQMAAPMAPAPVAAPLAESAPAAETEDADAGLHKITSPIVGTFYRSPGPDKDSYVSEGSIVSLCTSFRMTIGVPLLGSIIRALIFTSISMRAPHSLPQSSQQAAGKRCPTACALQLRS